MGTCTIGRTDSAPNARRDDIRAGCRCHTGSRSGNAVHGSRIAWQCRPTSYVPGPVRGQPEFLDRRATRPYRGLDEAGAQASGSSVCHQQRAGHAAGWAMRPGPLSSRVGEQDQSARVGMRLAPVRTEGAARVLEEWMAYTSRRSCVASPDGARLAWVRPGTGRPARPRPDGRSLALDRRMRPRDDGQALATDRCT